MGKYVRIVKAAGVEAATRSLKAEHKAERARFQAVERYLRDHRPEAWHRIQNCRTRPRVAKHVVWPDKYIVRLYGCHVEPWCFACAREAKYGRARRALERFQKCKPAGKEPRFAHIVQSAQLTEDGRGWGVQASREIQKFRDVIMRVVKDSYGPGFGAYVSYHHIGERGFGKVHPHLDFTINGWNLDAEGAQHTKTYNLKPGGHNLWVQRTRQHAAARYLIDPDSVETDLNIQPWVTGADAYRKALLYQVREIVDVRKMTYDRQRQIVYWQSYRNNRREKMTVQGFHDGLAEYQARVGAWGRYQAKFLHVGAGHLADKRVEKTKDAMGGEEPNHRKGCYCSDCEDWELVWPDENGEYEFDPWKPNR